MLFIYTFIFKYINSIYSWYLQKRKLQNNSKSKNFYTYMEESQIFWWYQIYSNTFLIKLNAHTKCLCTNELCLLLHRFWHHKICINCNIKLFKRRGEFMWLKSNEIYWDAGTQFKLNFISECDTGIRYISRTISDTFQGEVNINILHSKFMKCFHLQDYFSILHRA